MDSSALFLSVVASFLKGLERLSFKQVIGAEEERKINQKNFVVAFLTAIADLI